MKFKNENQNQNSELKSKIKNENQDSKSNLKNENENQKPNVDLKIEIKDEDSNLKFDYQTVILWLIANGQVPQALKDLQSYILSDHKEQEYDIRNYRATLNLISKISNEATVVDLCNDTLDFPHLP